MSDPLTGRSLGRKILWLLFGVLLGLPMLCAALPPLLFDGQTSAATHADNIATLDDPSGAYNVEQVPGLFAAQSVAPAARQDCLSLCWIKVIVRNTSNHDVVAQVDVVANVKYFNIWVVRADQALQTLAQGGEEAKTDQHDGAPHPNFTLKPGEEVTLYARLTRGKIFGFSTGHQLVISPLIVDLEETIPLSIAQGMLVGALLGLAIYNLLIAISTRDPSHRWYCAYLLMMTYSFIGSNGRAFLSLLMSSSHPLLSRTAGHAADALMWLCLIMFTRTFLNTPARMGKWDRLFLIPAAFLTVGFGLGFVPGMPWLAISYAGFVSAAPVGLLANVVALRQGFRPARFVLAGQLVLCLGALWQTASDYGWIDYDIDPQRAFLTVLGYKTLWVFSAIEAMIFSLALASRVKSLQEEVSVRVIQNLRDRETLINQQRVDLELEVAARTSDLVEEKSRSDRLLQNILPDEIAAELKLSGSTQPKRYDHASVLFTDFRGFTSVVSSLPADRLVQELNEIFRSFDDILDQVGVEKIKTIGDSYMIVAGVPAECQDHAVRCAEAALRMLEFISQRNQSASIKWEMRAGIHSGSVVAGIVGKRKFAYDIFGDTVNIASRMESAGLPGRLNVSAYTYDLIRHQFAGEYRGKVNAKGKGDVDMYFIERNVERDAGLAAG